ncbi:MAG: DUF1670 domain-containing protein [Candidatus Cloacimonetes bacterium]|nr:DUF1670 domain-containing protein [Candidatus Cloacimonadota bacterium]MCF7813903.1 DUF1670 domain-containing protein [Candidatus Cloacimonadota bacterium]MCF7868500.1 DUF1670 domain-containing protein [Candidatus Cloacimonadota bacterium]MCF7884015.1 DUF1670 domain-containing protein [Candidatus Cloacimonadota bacterium]
MTKPLTKAQIQLKKVRRLKDKSLKNHLLHRFLHNYGYDKGEVTAKAIVDDILQLLEDFFLVGSIDDDLRHIQCGQLVWMAVPTDEYPQRGKSIAQTRMKPVVLSLVTDADIDHIAFGFDTKTLRKNRIQRLVDEAFDQGALLTQLDLAMLLGMSDAVVSQYVNQIQKEGHLLPTRGNIHDLSGAITHKREIISLYLEGYLTPKIAAKTHHSKEAVDRYIKDYHRVEMLWLHGITELQQISHLSHLSPRVAQQYIDLLPQKLRYNKDLSSKKLDSKESNLDFLDSGETEAGSAGKQPARDNRKQEQVAAPAENLRSLAGKSVLGQCLKKSINVTACKAGC